MYRSLLQWPQCLDCLGVHKFPSKSQSDDVKSSFAAADKPKLQEQIWLKSDSAAVILSSYTNPKVFVDLLHLKANRFGFIRLTVTNVYLMVCSIRLYVDDSQFFKS